MSEYVCIKCGYVGDRKALKKGSGTVEWMLWLTLLIPGPFYSVWRRINKKHVCMFCGEDMLVPADSEGGQRIMERIEKGEIGGDFTSVAMKSHLMTESQGAADLGSMVQRDINAEIQELKEKQAKEKQAKENVSIRKEKKDKIFVPPKKSQEVYKPKYQDPEDW